MADANRPHPFYPRPPSTHSDAHIVVAAAIAVIAVLLIGVLA